MHINRLRIRNFRNFCNAEFRFESGINTLIGENGSGKSNVLYAIRLLLDGSLPRDPRFRDTDFNRCLSKWKGHWIIISIDFADLDNSEGCQILRHNAAHMNGSNTGTYTLYFRPKKAVRRQLFEASQRGETAEAFETLLTDIQLDQYELSFTGRGTCEFLDEIVYASLVGDFAKRQFPDPELDDVLLLGSTAVPLCNEVSCTFVQALRDVIAELRSNRDSPLLRLLRGAEKTIQLKESQSIVSQVDALNQEISALGEIREITADIQDTLLDTVGHTYSPTIEIQSALPSEIERLLQRLELRVADSQDLGYQGSLSELSLGGANLIYLSLKLLEYERKLSSDRVAHFLLIEEPEAHIHTHIQKTLFDKYSNKQTQVIVTTHSSKRTVNRILQGSLF